MENSTFLMEVSFCVYRVTSRLFHLRSTFIGEAKYKEYIEAVRKEFQKFPNVQAVVSLEPDSIGNRELIILHAILPRSLLKKTSL